MATRIPLLDDDKFSSSSFAVLVRGATQILARYHQFYTTQHYNLVWYHLSHIIICAHITLLAFHFAEIDESSAKQNLATATWILGLAEPRWTTSVSKAKNDILTLASAFGQFVFVA